MERPTVKTWALSNLPKQEELKNLCLIAVGQRNCKLWPLIHVTSKRLFAIGVSSWISTFMNFDLVCGDGGEQKEQLTQSSIPQFMANTVVHI